MSVESKVKSYLVHGTDTQHSRPLDYRAKPGKRSIVRTPVGHIAKLSRDIQPDETIIPINRYVLEDDLLDDKGYRGLEEQIFTESRGGMRITQFREQLLLGVWEKNAGSLKGIGEAQYLDKLYRVGGADFTTDEVHTLVGIIYPYVEDGISDDGVRQWIVSGADHKLDGIRAPQNWENLNRLAKLNDRFGEWYASKDLGPDDPPGFYDALMEYNLFGRRLAEPLATGGEGKPVRSPRARSRSARLHIDTDSIAAKSLKSYLESNPPGVRVESIVLTDDADQAIPELYHVRAEDGVTQDLTSIMQAQIVLESVIDAAILEFFYEITETYGTEKLGAIPAAEKGRLMNTYYDWLFQRKDFVRDSFIHTQVPAMQSRRTMADVHLDSVLRPYVHSYFSALNQKNISMKEKRDFRKRERNQSTSLVSIFNNAYAGDHLDTLCSTPVGTTHKVVKALEEAYRSMPSAYGDLLITAATIQRRRVDAAHEKLGYIGSNNHHQAAAREKKIKELETQNQQTMAGILVNYSAELDALKKPLPDEVVERILSLLSLEVDPHLVTLAGGRPTFSSMS
ncbi:MAG: hypothetical protein ABIC95_06195 [archaeon]